MCGTKSTSLPPHTCAPKFPRPQWGIELGNRGAGAVLQSIGPAKKSFKNCLFEGVARKMWRNKGNRHIGNLCGNGFLGIFRPGFGFGVIFEAFFVGSLNF